MQIHTSTHLYFWQKESIYSNWYSPSPIELCLIDKTIKFKNSESMFMYLKALQFDDLEIAESIVENQNPYSVKKLGRQIKGFNQVTWDSVREELMYIACLSKFNQNQKLKEELINTVDLILVEASPVDFIWGVGLAPDDPLVLDEKNWKGLNLLGKVLMKVRSNLTQ